MDRTGFFAGIQYENMMRHLRILTGPTMQNIYVLVQTAAELQLQIKFPDKEMYEEDGHDWREETISMVCAAIMQKNVKTEDRQMCLERLSDAFARNIGTYMMNDEIRAIRNTHIRRLMLPFGIFLLHTMRNTPIPVPYDDPRHSKLTMVVDNIIHANTNPLAGRLRVTLAGSFSSNIGYTVIHKSVKRLAVISERSKFCRTLQDLLVSYHFTIDARPVRADIISVHINPHYAEALYPLFVCMMCILIMPKTPAFANVHVPRTVFVKCMKRMAGRIKHLVQDDESY